MADEHFLGVFGHVVLDYIFDVPRLPEPNTSIQVEGRNRFFGGTGANTARWATRLGVSTALASFVGPDFPAEFREALAADGVDLTDLREVPGYGTPTAWIFTDPEGQQIAIVDQGPMRDAGKFEVLEHAVRSARLVHLGTGRPEFYVKVAALAAELGKEIALDPSQEIHYVYDAEHLRALLEPARYLFGNEIEIARALHLLDLEEPTDLVAFVDVLVVTRGKAGSVVYTEQAETPIPRIEPDRLVDVTGAGDAYRAGFYAGLSRGEPVERAAVLGAAAASFALETRGTQTRIPTWEQVRGRAETVPDF
jgi:sugar/nucleoside kinase (ribokinase family)